MKPQGITSVEREQLLEAIKRAIEWVATFPEIDANSHAARYRIERNLSAIKSHMKLSGAIAGDLADVLQLARFITPEEESNGKDRQKSERPVCHSGAGAPTRTDEDGTGNKTGTCTGADDGTAR